MGPETDRTVRSRIGKQHEERDGTTRCRLLIPLGQAASRRRDQDGEVFEVENEIGYVAGPGSQALRMVDPASGAELTVGGNLLPASEEKAARISADNLAAYLRKASRRFDREVASTVGEDET